MKTTKTMKANEIWKSTRNVFNRDILRSTMVEISETLETNAKSMLDTFSMFQRVFSEKILTTRSYCGAPTPLEQMKLITGNINCLLEMVDNIQFGAKYGIEGYVSKQPLFSYFDIVDKIRTLREDLVDSIEENCKSFEETANLDMVYRNLTVSKWENYN